MIYKVIGNIVKVYKRTVAAHQSRNGGFFLNKKNRTTEHDSNCHEDCFFGQRKFILVIKSDEIVRKVGLFENIAKTKELYNLLVELSLKQKNLFTKKNFKEFEWIFTKTFTFTINQNFGKSSLVSLEEYGTK